MSDLQDKAQKLRELTSECLKAQQHLKECRERADQASEKLHSLREFRGKALDDLYEEALGKDLAKTQILMWS